MGISKVILTLYFFSRAENISYDFEMSFLKGADTYSKFCWVYCCFQIRLKKNIFFPQNVNPEKLSFKRFK